MSAEMIQSVTVGWETPYTLEAWESLQRKGASSSIQGDREIRSLGPVLPDEDDERIAVLTGHIHLDGRESKIPQELHWNLNIRPRPTSDPPDQVKQINETLGGRRGLMTWLDKSMVGVPPVALLLVTLFVPNEYDCKVLPLNNLSRGGEHDIAASLARSSRLEQVGYRFEDSPYGLDEVSIVYAHLENRFIVTFRASVPLKIGKKRWVPAADDMCDIVMRAFFERGQGGHD